METLADRFRRMATENVAREDDSAEARNYYHGVRDALELAADIAEGHPAESLPGIGSGSDGTPS